MTDASQDFSNFSCYQDLFLLDEGIHYYDVYEFTVTQYSMFTFFLDTDWGDGSAALYQGSFDGDNPCENIISRMEDPIAGNLFFAGFDPIGGIVLPLKPGETYYLLTTSFGDEITGNYQWTIFSEGPGQITGLPQTAEQLTFDLLCSDIDDLIDNDDSYAYLGFATPFDNCTATVISVDDNLTEVGDCGEKYITRTYTVSDGYNNAVSCDQRIDFRNPTLADVILPNFTAVIECDEGFATLENGYPSPSVTGLSICTDCIWYLQPG